MADRVSDLSDIYPAGQTKNIPRETLRSSGSAAWGDVGRGEAMAGVPGRSRSRGDSAFADVPANEMEPHGGHARRVSSTRVVRDVSLDVRLTKAEREAVRARAQVLRVKPSAWARAVILDALDSRSSLEAAMRESAREMPNPELAAAVEQLRRVGINLNTALRNGQAVEATLLLTVFEAVNDVRSVLGDRTRS